MTELQIEISPNFEAHLLNLDEKNVSKFIREHTKRQNIKRKRRSTRNYGKILIGDSKM